MLLATLRGRLAWHKLGCVLGHMMWPLSIHTPPFLLAACAQGLQARVALHVHKDDVALAVRDDSTLAPAHGQLA
jgi:hypothetical protein